MQAAREDAVALAPGPAGSSSTSCRAAVQLALSDASAPLKTSGLAQCKLRKGAPPQEGVVACDFCPTVHGLRYSMYSFLR